MDPGARAKWDSTKVKENARTVMRKIRTPKEGDE